MAHRPANSVPYVRYPDLETAAEQVNREILASAIGNGGSLATVSDIPSLNARDGRSCQLRLTNDADIVVLVNHQVSGPQNVPTRNDLAFVTATFPNARILKFELESFFDGPPFATLSTEAARLLQRLTRLKAQDITSNIRPLRDLLPES